MLPFFSALLYGGIGIEISSAILSSVFSPGVAYTTDGVLLPIHSLAVNRSICAIVEARSCFGDYVKEQQVEIANRTALSAMLSVASVRYALQVHIILKRLYNLWNIWWSYNNYTCLNIEILIIMLNIAEFDEENPIWNIFPSTGYGVLWIRHTVFHCIRSSKKTIFIFYIIIHTLLY